MKSFPLCDDLIFLNIIEAGLSNGISFRVITRNCARQCLSLAPLFCVELGLNQDPKKAFKNSLNCVQRNCKNNGNNFFFYLFLIKVFKVFLCVKDKVQIFQNILLKRKKKRNKKCQRNRGQFRGLHRISNII